MCQHPYKTGNRLTFAVSQDGGSYGLPTCKYFFSENYILISNALFLLWRLSFW